MNRMDRLSSNQFNGFHMNCIPIVEDLLTLKNYLLYDLDIVDGNIMGEIARRGVQKYEKTVRRSSYNIHTCFMRNNIAVFQSFRCSNYDTFFRRTFNLERQLTTFSERVKSMYPKKVYQIRETLLDKVDCFGIKYTREQKCFKNLKIFNFESICVQEKSFKDTKTRNWIGKHVPISVFIF